MISPDQSLGIDKILDLDNHLVHFLAALNVLNQKDARNVIAHAVGPYVYDADGNQFIDGIGVLWCINVGDHHQRRNP